MKGRSRGDDEEGTEGDEDGRQGRVTSGCVFRRRWSLLSLGDRRAAVGEEDGVGVGGLVDNGGGSARECQENVDSEHGDRPEFDFDLALASRLNAKLRGRHAIVEQSWLKEMGGCYGLRVERWRGASVESRVLSVVRNVRGVEQSEEVVLFDAGVNTHMYVECARWSIDGQRKPKRQVVPLLNHWQIGTVGHAEMVIEDSAHVVRGSRETLSNSAKSSVARAVVVGNEECYRNQIGKYKLLSWLKFQKATMRPEDPSLGPESNGNPVSWFRAIGTRLVRRISLEVRPGKLCCGTKVDVGHVKVKPTVKKRLFEAWFPSFTGPPVRMIPHDLP
ncbi:hypothetical protein C8R45DRAFT_946332 [Mycena sanguinolenta]|nr:hypothetical protein C8R45DRAFT_946332 [Mycena sanguinolenta]